MGPRVDWLPYWLADGWRGAVFVLSLFVLFRLSRSGLRAREHHDLPTMVIGRAALFVFAMQAALQNAVLWGGPVYYTGLPLVTVGMVLAARYTFVAEDQVNGRYAVMRELAEISSQRGRKRTVRDDRPPGVRPGDDDSGAGGGTPAA
jgi:hypothetical protein